MYTETEWGVGGCGLWVVHCGGEGADIDIHGLVEIPNYVRRTRDSELSMQHGALPIPRLL